MNTYLSLSIDYANQRSYLDDLFRVYPTIPEGIREINKKQWKIVESNFEKRDNINLVKALLGMDLFPIKDSYIAYLKRDGNAIERNPKTIDRIAGRLYEIGIEKIYENCTLPKETNRQIGPMFKKWVAKGCLGIKPTNDVGYFLNTPNNAILDASDKQMMDFASRHLNYNHEKGLDFLAKFNGQYVIGEAKFLTDFGGHQNAQLNDALSTITQPNVKAIKIAILDGVLYIPGNNKMYKTVTKDYGDYNILSALVLREFLYSI